MLHGISLHIPAGAHVAIVGETGCGKTTFAKLLTRLADPREGRIEVNGVDLRDVAPASRRTAIRMVPQDGFLFDATLRENVRYGREGATDRDVETAFEELGLGDWVASLPEGLDTIAGERGEAMSVGERQLVALARAQVASPGLLILDEATSAVDPGTERRINEALRRLGQGRTVVTIAHRLSTAEGADHVFVFDAGRLIEEGTHADLAGRGGRYAQLYGSWLGNTQEPVAVSDFVDGLRSSAAASLFPVEGSLTLAGLHAPVDVGRDAWGVPYLQAASQDDLWFAQGVLTAGERLFQLDLLLRAANGRLSEVFAERTLADDRFARTVGLHRAGAKMAARWTERDRAMHRRFREGVFAWIEAMPAPPVEYTLLDLRPELPPDEPSWAAAFSYLAWGLSGNWDKELLRAWIRERAGDEAAARLLPSPPSDLPAVTPGAHFGAIFDALPAHGGPGLQRLGRRGVADGGRQAAAGERPAPARDPARPLGGVPPVGARLPRAGRGAHLLPGHPAGHHRASRLGRHERHRRHAGPLRGTPQRGTDFGRVRGRVGATHRPPRGDRGPRLRARHLSTCARPVTDRCSTRS